MSNYQKTLKTKTCDVSSSNEVGQGNGLFPIRLTRTCDALDQRQRERRMRFSWIERRHAKSWQVIVSRKNVNGKVAG
jgi:hypothetical protein